MRPTLSIGGLGYGVALLGEALGKDEAEEGSPFVGKAGFRLTRLIEWAGLERSKFDIYNAVWCRPPDNKLSGESYEKGAIAHCRANHWDSLLPLAKVVVPMGNVPTAALGISNGGILTARGYVYPGPSGQHIIPTVHPSFIQRGQSRWSAPFINDLQKAVELARSGLPFVVQNYRLDPTPLEALRWAEGYIAALRADPTIRLAFDIETPGKGDDEDDLDTGDAPDRTWNIERIGFAFRPYEALSIPWAPPYFAAIRLLLGTNGDKIVWNAGFDVPRIRRAGVEINGIIHDGMVAWHILHTDLPKRLGFVATFTCPWQPAWKHLSGSKPAFYNATDADVELRSMIEIEKGLRSAGLWDVYQKDVIDLDPILVHMHQKGMPVDEEVRLDRALKLAEKLIDVKKKMEEAVPLEARRIAHVYKLEPADKTGLRSRPTTRRVSCCPGCGIEKPRKDHFKRFVKKHNPCADLVPVEVEREVQEYYRLSEFTPSREQLVRYHEFLGRPCPLVFDKKSRTRKISFGEAQLKELALKYPEDVLYSYILDYRGLDKIGGSYLGRPVDDGEAA